MSFPTTYAFAGLFKLLFKLADICADGSAVPPIMETLGPILGIPPESDAPGTLTDKIFLTFIHPVAIIAAALMYPNGGVAAPASNALFAPE